MTSTQKNICSGSICFREGRTGNLDQPHGVIPVTAEIMAGQARVGDRGFYRGHSGWNLRRELKLEVRTGTTEESGVRKGAMVQTPTPRNNTEKDSGAAESEVLEGGQVTKPPPSPPPGQT